MPEQDKNTFGRARVTFADEAEIDEFAATLARFERGEITPDAWRAFRLVRGTYGQRQSDDAQMVRVKVPQGVLSTDQLEALADVATRYSRGFGHITTRQNIQFHFVKLHDVEPVMRRLAEAGLTTREACGNSVRNITTCPLAGVSATEAFDVTPYAEALTRHLLRHPFSATLPRKFKIAFEGCADDHIKAAINDIGWRARIVEGRKGFRVFAGGGTSTMATTATVLIDFLPAADLLDVAEAIVRVFHARGDYQHKARNRMKFLIKTMGWSAFKAEFERTLEIVRRVGHLSLPFDPERPPFDAPRPASGAAPSLEAIAAVVRSTAVRGPGITPDAKPSIDEAAGAAPRWRASNVAAQRQPDFVTVTVTVPLGDVTAGQWRAVAQLASAYADGTVRISATQNLLFRFVRPSDVNALYLRLSAAGLGRPDAETIADVTSCPGAESCKLAVTQSRGLAVTLAASLRDKPSLIRQTPTLDVKVSGCPNGCGQHHIAAVGFQGSLRKLDARAVPQYFVTIGGGMHGDHATFGRIAAKVPARRAPVALERLARLFAAERQPAESAAAFFSRVEIGKVKALLADLERLTAETATADDFIDLAETGPFRPEMQEGECSA
jgi:sulfite reductase (NADPH) hemoprotein beta-component